MPLAGAASLAAMVSILRVALVITLIEPSVFPTVAAPALAAALSFGACGMLLFRKGGKMGDAPARNPFDLAPLLLFALFFGMVATAGAALSKISGISGLVATSSLSGALDVDVAVLGAIRLVGGSIDATVAGQAVLAALAANAITRVALAAAVAPPRFSLALAGFTLLALVVGYGVYRLMPV